MYLPIFETRDELLIYLINTYSLKTGVEVGVRDCYFSKFLLENTKNFFLCGVDIQITPTAIDFASNNTERFKLIYSYSDNYAKSIVDESLDIVHIDAGHTYDDVKLDILNWWPKIKPGGFLTGDDYVICNTPNEGDYGIVQAVEEWVDNNNKDIYLTQIGYTNKEKRLRIAEYRGRQVEDNLKRMYEPHRPYHENAHVPCWVVRKDL